MMPQPPYSPDLAPCDFYLFPRLKRPMKGRRYATLDEIKTASKEELKKILKNDFFEVLRRLEKPLAQVLRGCRHEPKTSFEWYKRFKEGREETADNERSGRPSTAGKPEKVDKVLEMVREDRRITVREVAEEAGISFGSTQSIMKDILGVKRLNAVLKDLTFDQKNARKETASPNLEATTDDLELLKRIITGDETCIYGFDLETTQQASEWRFKNEPRPKKARKAPSKVKVMLTVFFDYQGIVHHEFQKQGSTITSDSYLGVLRRLSEPSYCLPGFGGGPGVVNPTPTIEQFLAQRGFWERGDELQYASLEHPTHALLDSGPEIWLANPSFEYSHSGDIH
ncbi:hypothetical protein LAZ67_14001618 [Cordylochernes scorpioides]|uniref:Transposase n=1 Tax=Cordylochernes scorpioides TaxID=51811 RepID=A0ABY6L664_9ARAC|nr:hypothetical protein LAZ67_14001618 [Cordylochernes scorpioides]